MTRNASDTVPLKLATSRVAGELESLHGRLERLEFGLEAVFAHSRAGLEGQTIGMIQELDMLRQSLGALADYLEHLSEATDAAGQSDQATALRAMPLRDMAARLGGARHEAAASGLAELF